MADQDLLPGNWKQTRVRLKERWHGLTDDDLARIAGSRTVLAGILCEKLGYTEKQAEEQVGLFVQDVTAGQHA